MKTVEACFPEWSRLKDHVWVVMIMSPKKSWEKHSFNQNVPIYLPKKQKKKQPQNKAIMLAEVSAVFWLFDC